MEAMDLYKEETGKLEMYREECRAARKEVGTSLWTTLNVLSETRASLNTKPLWILGIVCIFKGVSVMV